jgi:hypothetical protein
MKEIKLFMGQYPMNLEQAKIELNAIELHIKNAIFVDWTAKNERAQLIKFIASF